MELAILHSGDLCGISPGGVDQYVKNVITGLTEDHVTLFGVGKTGIDAVGINQERRYQGVSYTFIPIINDSSYPLTPRYVKALVKYRSKLADYDCVFAQRSEFPLALMGSASSKRATQIVHGSSANAIKHLTRPRKLLHLVAEHLSILTCRKTIIILNRNDAGLPYYKRRYRSLSGRFIYKPIPVDFDLFKHRDKSVVRNELGLPDDVKLIAYAGRVENDPKRVFLYPAIAEKLPSDFHFVIVGDGSDLPNLKRMASAAGLSDRFHFAGFVNDRSLLAKYLAASDISINVSTDEGTCTSVLESLACGVPVVSTDTGDINEVLFDGKNGFVLRNESEEQIVQDAAVAIQRASDSPVAMNNSYERYEKRQALSELRHLLASLGSDC